MIQFVRPREPLSHRERFARAAFIFAITAALGLIACTVPGTIDRWTALRLSCGAVTGVPCVFCGLTRATHLLLRGDFGGAFYFNWLAFPLLAVVFAVILIVAFEFVLGRRCLRAAPMAVSGRGIAAFAVSFVLLWSLQIYLAVHGHKTELLNPNGPLYRLFVG